MNRFEKSDVPFVPSQIAQPEGGSIVAPPSAPRLTAEGGGNRATTVLAGVSGAFAPDVAMIMTSALELPAQLAGRPRGKSGHRADVALGTRLTPSSHSKHSLDLPTQTMQWKRGIIPPLHE